eukprot:TRINITY_DN24121_c0_g1_i1.p1 TRINITY_DN24121_c0_g1~~TRINITY_DN24121_c0_g1_i1.p1  ORF type:complete len:513 (-),score=18.52 TRINITY_DN24121_c0_g1_i1:198-1736(-)
MVSLAPDVDRLLNRAGRPISCWTANDVSQAAARPIAKLIDELGFLSTKAQGLPAVITSASKLSASDQKLYIHSEPGVATGILKVGYKKLFIRAASGQMHEITPLCVLDFYVHESRQRTGLGKLLFEHMLRTEGVSAARLGYDRPSSKFLSFLAKHYKLRNYVPQSNNFVVYQAYFDTNRRSSAASPEPFQGTQHSPDRAPVTAPVYTTPGRRTRPGMDQSTPGPLGETGLVSAPYAAVDEAANHRRKGQHQQQGSPDRSIPTAQSRQQSNPSARQDLVPSPKQQSERADHAHRDHAASSSSPHRVVKDQAAHEARQRAVQYGNTAATSASNRAGVAARVAASSVAHSAAVGGGAGTSAMYQSHLHNERRARDPGPPPQAPNPTRDPKVTVAYTSGARQAAYQATETDFDQGKENKTAATLAIDQSLRELQYLQQSMDRLRKQSVSNGRQETYTSTTGSLSSSSSSTGRRTSGGQSGRGGYSKAELRRQVADDIGPAPDARQVTGFASGSRPY